MRVKLLKDTPDLIAGAIFTTIKYNACTKDFLDRLENILSTDVYHFLDDEFVQDPSSVRIEDYIYYSLERIKALSEWFEIIEE